LRGVGTGISFAGSEAGRHQGQLSNYKKIEKKMRIEILKPVSIKQGESSPIGQKKS